MEHVCAERRVWVCVRPERAGGKQICVCLSGRWCWSRDPCNRFFSWESRGKGGSGPAGQVVSSLHMEDIAAIYWCDMQGHVARLRWEKCHAPLLGGGRAYLPDLQPPSQQVRELRRGINECGEKDEWERRMWKYVLFMPHSRGLEAFIWEKGECGPGACLQKASDLCI